MPESKAVKQFYLPEGLWRSYSFVSGPEDLISLLVLFSITFLVVERGAVLLIHDLTAFLRRHLVAHLEASGNNVKALVAVFLVTEVEEGRLES